MPKITLTASEDLHSYTLSSAALIDASSSVNLENTLGTFDGMLAGYEEDSTDLMSLLSSCRSGLINSTTSDLEVAIFRQQIRDHSEALLRWWMPLRSHNQYWGNHKHLRI
jgi:hypothetical protein